MTSRRAYIIHPATKKTKKIEQEWNLGQEIKRDVKMETASFFKVKKLNRIRAGMINTFARVEKTKIKRPVQKPATDGILILTKWMTGMETK